MSEIVNHESNFVNIDITLDEDILLALFILAHEQNITFNKLINNILRKQLKELGYEISKSNESNSTP